MLRVCSATYSTQLSARNRVRYCQEQTDRRLEVSLSQRPNPKTLIGDKVDSGIGLESILAYKVAPMVHALKSTMESTYDMVRF
jgi:hypothetical protein